MYCLETRAVEVVAGVDDPIFEGDVGEQEHEKERRESYGRRCISSDQAKISDGGKPSIKGIKPQIGQVARRQIN